MRIVLKRVAATALSACAIGVIAIVPARAAAPSGLADAAQSYPNRPVRLIAPFVPGGPTDIVARLIAQKMGENLKQTFVVDNRGGAGGSVGMEIAAGAAPDGYTLVIGSSGNLAVNPALNPKLPYHPLQDFQPLTQTTSGPQVLVINPGVAAKSIQEFIALAKSKPGQLNYGSGGTGTTTHLGVELFKLAAGVNIVHVPYKGTGQSLTDVIGGQVQMMMSSMLPAVPHVKSGRLRALGVTSTRRSAVYPELPTLAESGLPGFETTSWHGVLVPVRTPKAVVSRIHAELVRMLTQADVKAIFANQGMDVVASTQEDFAAYIRSETAKWTKVIKAIGIKSE
jgi:tripartite-type tricarboxylate transporter receptor subunit TctC